MMTKEEERRAGFDDSPTARGKRAKTLRNALRFSRRALTEKYGLKPATLQNWEDVRHGGLTEHGVKILTNIFQTEGLNCHPEWLFYGLGEDPLQEDDDEQQANNQQPIDAPASQIDYQTALRHELHLFQQHQTHVVDAIVKDDGMLPGLWPGDYVAGKRYFTGDINKLFGTPCIVQTEAGETWVRLVEAGDTEGRYSLKCLNPDTTAAQPSIENVAIFSITPILWVRRNQNFFL